jgi:hypothetical protein
MFTSLLHRSAAGSKALRAPLSRNVHSMTFRGAMGAPNAMYTGAFQKMTATQNSKLGSVCVESHSPILLPAPLSNIFVRGFKSVLKKPKTKLKTKKAAKKRFILTGRGKLKRNHSGKVRERDF